jgi:hypothetical protein
MENLDRQEGELVSKTLKDIARSERLLGATSSNRPRRKPYAV